MSIRRMCGAALGLWAGLALANNAVAADTLDDMGDLYISLVAGHEISGRCETIGAIEERLYQRAANQLTEDIGRIGQRLRDPGRASAKLAMPPITKLAQDFVEDHGCRSDRVRQATANWHDLLVMFPYRPQFSGLRPPVDTLTD